MDLIFLFSNCETAGRALPDPSHHPPVWGAAWVVCQQTVRTVPDRPEAVAARGLTRHLHTPASSLEYAVSRETKAKAACSYYEVVLLVQFFNKTGILFGTQRQR